MNRDAESTADLSGQYKLVRRVRKPSWDDGGVRELATQVGQGGRRSGGRKICAILGSICTCFTKKSLKVRDLNPPTAASFLPVQSPHHQNRPTLILDLDETLIHSVFDPVPSSDLIVKVSLEGSLYDVYVTTRPGLHQFLSTLSELYELVAFTASLEKYADPVLDQIDPDRYIAHRLFREHCSFTAGVFVKDLGKLGRSMQRTAIIDVINSQNSPVSYMMHKDNAVPIRSFIGEEGDEELGALLPMLVEMSRSDDIPSFLAPFRQTLALRACTDVMTKDERLECNSPREP